MFYDILGNKATRYNNFVHPSSEITHTEDVIPDSICVKLSNMTTTILYSKKYQKHAIYESYTDTYNLIDATRHGYELLQLLLQHTYPLLTVKKVATVDISKYSMYRHIFRYTREIKQYMPNHEMKKRPFSDREITYMFLSHLDNPYYAKVVHDCEALIPHCTVANPIYLAPTISGTINQLNFCVSRNGTSTIKH